MAGGSLLSQLRRDLEVHGGSLRSAGFRALAVYRLGAWRNQRRSPLARKPVWVLHELLRRRVRAHSGIELHHTADIGQRVRLHDGGHVVVGNESVIGDDCTLGPGATIAKTRAGRKGRPSIGDRVTVGPGATFVGGVRVGDEAVIGPNAVVLVDVPAGATLLAPAVTIEPHEPRSARSPVESIDGLVVFAPSTAPPGVHVGRGVVRARSGPPRLFGPVEIGDGCRLHERVTVGWGLPGAGEGRTRLGRRVVLGAGSVVLRGVVVGEDVLVGPNAVVDQDVPDGMRVTARPSRVLPPLAPPSPTDE